jgi:hypothetical protein
MVAKRKGQNSLGGTTGCDVYEVRPRKSGDGVDLISDRFRYGPIWYAGPDAVRYAVAYAKYRSLARSQRAKIGRVGRLRRCNPDALIQGRFSPVAKAPFVLTLSAGDWLRHLPRLFSHGRDSHSGFKRRCGAHHPHLVKRIENCD